MPSLLPFFLLNMILNQCPSVKGSNTLNQQFPASVHCLFNPYLAPFLPNTHAPPPSDVQHQLWEDALLSAASAQRPGTSGVGPVGGRRRRHHRFRRQRWPLHGGRCSFQQCSGVDAWTDPPSLPIPDHPPPPPIVPFPRGVAMSIFHPGPFRPVLHGSISADNEKSRARIDVVDNHGCA